MITSVPSCDGCGSCCTTFDVIPVEITDRPISPALTEPVGTMITERGVLSVKKMKILVDEDGNKRCAAFDTKHKICTIYGSRPQTCRDFQPGCHLCLQTKHMSAGVGQTEAMFKADKDFNKDLITYMQLKRESKGGIARVSVNGVWKNWICVYCFSGAKRICHINHQKGCKREEVESAYAANLARIRNVGDVPPTKRRDDSDSGPLHIDVEAVCRPSS